MITTLDNITFSYKDEIVLDKLSLTIGDNDRIGLIGENGSGKTTLINLIVGRLIADSGDIFSRRNLTIGYLEQNSGLESEITVMDEMRTCFSSLLKMESRMREIEQLMAELNEDTTSEYRALANEYNHLKKGFEGLDGYNVDVKIRTILNGMGFLNLYDRIISTFSGGEKTRLAIAKLLLQSPDLLILDEPTNHLDFETLTWLEEYLRTYKGGLLIVSHDRFFLDKTVNLIWEIEDQKIAAFKGNYTKYKELKRHHVEHMLKEFDKQQEEIAKMEDYVARNLTRASTAKSAQSRIKKLDALDRIDKPITIKKNPKFLFTKGYDPTKEIVRITNLTLTAGEKVLFENGNVLVPRGEKVAIVGENGTGKSTLLRSIIRAFEEKKDDCEYVFGKNIAMSYYDQENLNLNFDNTVMDELWDKYPRSNVYELRKTLGRMLFEEEDMTKKVSVLSGGERARLGFAIMMLTQSNFLVLDEPTNHIDLETRESLEKSLVEYDGTVLFVSHDRYFLNAIATKVIRISKDGITTYNMGFNDYLNKISEENAEQVLLEKAEKLKNVKIDNKTQFKNTKERKEEARLKIELKNLENEISALEKEEVSLNNDMTKPEIASDYELFLPIMERLEALQQEINNKFAEWEILNGKIF